MTQQPVWKTLFSLGDRGCIFVDETGVYDPCVELWDDYEPSDDAQYPDDECDSYIDAEDRWCKATREQHTVEAGGTGEDVSSDACREFAQEEDRKRFYVYRVNLKRYSAYKGLLDKEWKVIPYGFHLRTDLPKQIENYEEWFSENLDSVADSDGCTRQELVDKLCSDDPIERWHAYAAIGGNYGWENFDGYPLDLSEKELDARIEARDIAEKERKKEKKRRVVQLSLAPHGRCATSAVCVEHVYNKNIPSCKKSKKSIPGRLGRGRRSL